MAEAVNTYSTKFFAVCPANGIRIEYDLLITSGKTILVESILRAIDRQAGYHEDIADQLHALLGGDQVLTANHHSVTITTYRKSP